MSRGPSPALAADVARLLTPALLEFRAQRDASAVVTAADTPADPRPAGAGSAAITVPGSLPVRPPNGSGTAPR